MGHELYFVLGLCLLMFHTAMCLDNGLLLTPPMGWMSWAEFYCEIDCVTHPNACINDKLYMEQAERLVSDGYQAVGYTTIHVDDCWMERKRDAHTHRLVANRTRFPDGIEALAEFVHARGLELGFYEDYGSWTCTGYPGSLAYLNLDAETFAEWHIDYLKLDGCNANVTLMADGYPEMGKYLLQTNHSIAYSCSWPFYETLHNMTPNYTNVAEHCNVWRVFTDIYPSWASIQSIIDFIDENQDALAEAVGPGAWFDPDMLLIGHPQFTVTQARTQMSLWCIWAAPLIMSNDLRNMKPEFRDILQNAAAIAVNQDPLSKMGKRVYNIDQMGLSIYRKPIIPVDSITNSTSYALVVYNRNNDTQRDISISLSLLGLNFTDGYLLQDVWSAEPNVNVVEPNQVLKFLIEPMDVVFLTAKIVTEATLAQYYAM